MKKTIIFLAVAVLLSPGAAQAGVIRGIGAQLGGAVALGDLGRNLNPGFAGSVIIKGPRLFIPVELYLGWSRQMKKETDNTRLILMPVFLSTRIDLRRPASGRGAWPFVRIGLGGVFESAVTARQGTFENFDPGLLLAAGFSLGLDRKLSLGLDAGYLFVFQTHQRGAEYDGHFLRLGFGLDWLF